MVVFLLKIISLDFQKKLNQISKKERLNLVKILKKLLLTILNYISLDQVIITFNEIFKKEIDPLNIEIEPG